MRLPDIWKYENFDIVKQRNPTDNLFTSIILFCFNRVNYKKTIFILYSYTCMRGIGGGKLFYSVKFGYGFS
jgi:hypothetical protein